MVMFIAQASGTAPMCCARKSPSPSEWPRSCGNSSLGQSSVPLAPSNASSASPCPTSTWAAMRSEEHTSELQSRLHLVCRLLLEKKKKKPISHLLYKKKKEK